MSINKVRSALYTLAKLLGDVNAVCKNKVGQRILRLGAGKVTGSIFRKWFK